jgi:hypothetical protein
VERRDDARLEEIGHGPRVGLRGVPRTRVTDVTRGTVRAR